MPSNAAPPIAATAMTITGIGGFIGTALAKRALASGVKVRGIERDRQRASAARALGADVIEGDILDPDATRAACQGCDVLVHTVAIVGEDGDMSAYRRVNVEGTARVFEAARSANISRAIHLSSVMVYGFDYPANADEDTPLYEGNNPYCLTKRDGERCARTFDDPAGGMRVTILRPGDVYGPGSIPWVQRPLALMRRGLFMLPDGGRGQLNHVHVENLVDAVADTLRRDVGGAVFNITDGRASTCMAYFSQLAATAGLPPPRTAPSWMMRPLFHVLDRGSSWLGRTSPASPAAIDFLCRPHAYSVASARASLGYAPRTSLEEGMAALRATTDGDGT